MINKLNNIRCTKCNTSHHSSWKNYVRSSGENAFICTKCDKINYTRNRAFYSISLLILFVLSILFIELSSIDSLLKLFMIFSLFFITVFLNKCVSDKELFSKVVQKKYKGFFGFLKK